MRKVVRLRCRVLVAAFALSLAGFVSPVFAGSHTVLFESGGHGWFGGSDPSYSDTVEDGLRACEPTVVADEWWVFVGWAAPGYATDKCLDSATEAARWWQAEGRFGHWQVPLESVTSNVTVRAVYRPVSPLYDEVNVYVYVSPGENYWYDRSSPPSSYSCRTGYAITVNGNEMNSLPPDSRWELWRYDSSASMDGVSNMGWTMVCEATPGCGSSECASVGWSDQENGNVQFTDYYVPSMTTPMSPDDRLAVHYRVELRLPDYWTNECQATPSVFSSDPCGYEGYATIDPTFTMQSHQYTIGGGMGGETGSEMFFAGDSIELRFEASATSGGGMDPGMGESCPCGGMCCEMCTCMNDPMNTCSCGCPACSGGGGEMPTMSETIHFYFSNGWECYSEDFTSDTCWSFVRTLMEGDFSASWYSDYGTYSGDVSGWVQTIPLVFEFGESGYPTESPYWVQFDLGEHGQCVFGETCQYVDSGFRAVAPIVKASEGWVFEGWDASFDNVTCDTTVTAQYRPAAAENGDYAVNVALGSIEASDGGALTLAGEAWCAGANAPSSLTLLGNLTWSVWGSDADGSNAVQVWSGSPTFSDGDAFTLAFTPSEAKAQYWVCVTEGTARFETAPILAPVTSRPVAVIDSIQPDEPTDAAETVFTGHGTNGTIVAYRWTAQRLEDGAAVGGETLLGASQVAVATLPAGDWRIAFAVQDENEAWSEAVTRDVAVASALPKADLSVSAETLAVRDERALAVAVANVGTTLSVSFQVANAGDADSASGAMAYLFDGSGQETADELLALSQTNGRVLGAVPLAAIAAGESTDVTLSWTVGKNAAGATLGYGDEVRLLTVVVVPAASAAERTTANNIARKGFGVGTVDDGLKGLLGVTISVPPSVRQNDPFTVSGRAVYTLGSTKTPAAGLGVSLAWGGKTVSTARTDANGGYSVTLEDGLKSIGDTTFVVTVTDGHVSATDSATTRVRTPEETTGAKCDIAVTGIACAGSGVRATSAGNYAACPGEEVGVKVTLKNKASLTSGSFNVRLEATREGATVDLGTRRVNALSYDESETLTVDLPQPMLQQAGNWIVSATADSGDELDEANELNNYGTCRLALEVERPDLRVSVTGVSASRKVVGDSVLARVRVTNFGPGLVTNAFVTAVKYGWRTLAETTVSATLAPDESRDVELEVPTEKLSDGESYLTFTVDAGNAVDEANEENNSDYSRIWLYPNAAEFLEEKARIFASPSPTVGKASTLTLRLVNTGGKSLPGGRVAFTIEGRDVEAEVGEIAAFGGSATAKAEWTPTLSGTSCVRARFYDRSQLCQLDMTKIFDVAAQHVPAPNLSIASSGLTIDPAQVNVGQTVTFKARMFNVGDKEASNVSVVFELEDAKGNSRVIATESGVSIDADTANFAWATYPNIAAGCYVLRVTVSDPEETGDCTDDNSATKSFSVGEPLPIFATNDVQCVIGETCRLDATPSCWSKSFDWTLVSKPEGSRAQLNKATTSDGNNSFTADVKGDYLVSLCTHYGEATSLPAEFRATASLRRLIATAGTGGKVSPSARSTWPDGATAVVTATPDDGYRFVAWEVYQAGTCQCISDGVATCAIEMTANYNVFATFERSRFTITYSEEMGTANPNPAAYDIGQSFTFAPLPDTDDWAFAGWDIPGVTADMKGDLVVTANWRWKGSVVTETGWHLDGSRVAYGPYTTYLHTNVLETVALANAVITNGQTRYACIGYEAAFGEKTFSGADASFGFVPPCDGSVRWLYETNHWFSAAADTNGTIACSEPGWKVHGSTETIAFTPAAHHHYAGLSGTGVSGCVVADGAITVPMTCPRVLKVSFALDTRTVTFDPGGHGAFTSGGSSRLPRKVSVGWGLDATVPDLKPDAGWTFLGWDADATNVTEDATLHALYEAIVYNITYEDPTGAARGVANPNAAVTNYSAEATVTFQELPDLWDLKFDGWTPPSTSGRTCDLTVKANWSRIPATVKGLPSTGSWFVGDTVRTSFVSPVIADGMKRELVSWRVTGGTNETAVAEGGETNVAFTVDCAAPYQLESVWATNYLLEVVAPTNGSLTGAESGWIPAGSNVTLVATPPEGYVVASWSGDTDRAKFSSDQTELTFAMNRPRKIGVSFKLHPYTVTYDCPLWEWRRDNTNRTAFTREDAFVFAPLPDRPEMRFIRWEPAGVEAGTESNVTAKAIWEWRYGHTTFDGETATNETIVGNSVKRDLTRWGANRAIRYDCTNWTVWAGSNAITNGTNTVCAFEIPCEGDFHVTLDAVVTNYLLSVAWPVGGLVSGVTNDEWHVAGSTVELVAWPEADYVFRGWSGNRSDDTAGLSGLNETNLLVVMDRPRSLYASFAHPYLDLAAAVNAPNLDWTVGGDSFWTAEWDSASSDGRHCAESGRVDAGETAELVASFGGKGSLSFAWRWTGSSVSNVVRLVVDGVEERRLDAVTAWQTVTVELGFGRHEVRWVVEASDPDAANDGVASLDQVTWLSRGDGPLDVTFKEALNFTNDLAWTTGGDVAWQANVSEFAYEGGAAAYSGLMGADETGFLATTVQGPGRVSFAWQNTAPEESVLSLAVDGKTVLTNAGETGWMTAQVDVSGDGAHTLKWTCRVLEIDANSALGGCGALDYVAWTPGTTEKLAARPQIEKADTQEFYAWLAAKSQIAAPTTEPVVSKKVATIRAKADEVADNGKGMTLLEEFIAGTDPTDADDVFHAEIAVGANGLPEVKWEPQLNSGESKTGRRRYRVYGSNEISDPSKWHEVQSTEDCRFFRVTVELP